MVALDRVDQVVQPGKPEQRDNDPVALACAIERAGPQPEVAPEATDGWYWGGGRARGVCVAVLDLIDAFDFEVEALRQEIGARLRRHAGYQALQTIPGVGPTFAAVFVAEC